MKKLTAEEALKLSKENNPAFITENILTMVEEAAKNGKFSIKVRSYGYGESNLYNGRPPAHLELVINELITLGYKANIRVDERQFVDIYLEVGWGDLFDPKS